MAKNWWWDSSEPPHKAVVFSQELVSLRQTFARAPWNWHGKKQKKCCLQKSKAEARQIQFKTLSVTVEVFAVTSTVTLLARGLEFRLGNGFSPFREDELQVACLVGLPAGKEPKTKTTDTTHTDTRLYIFDHICVLYYMILYVYICVYIYCIYDAFISH